LAKDVDLFSRAKHRGAADVNPGTGWANRHARWTLASLYGVYLVFMVLAFANPGARAQTLGSGNAIFLSVALLLSLVAATRDKLSRRTRRAWWLFAIGFAFLAMVPALAVRGGNNGLPGPPGGASLADLGRLLASIFMLFGLLSLRRIERSSRETAKLALDILTVVGGSFMLIWYFVIGPVVTSHPLSPLAVAAAMQAPVGDLVLIFGATVVLLRGPHPSHRRSVILFVTGMACLVAADCFLTYLRTHDHRADPSTVFLMLTMTGMFLMALAALEQCLSAAGHPAAHIGPSRVTAASSLPYMSLAVGYGLLLAVAVRDQLLPWLGLIVGAAVMTGAVAARQLLALRENHDMAVTDSLTGLANRVLLHEVVARAVDRADRTNHRAAVFVIDLDRFKQINDTLGHHAGDQLLVGFANLLKANVLGSDTVARLGGDEFAIIAHDVDTASNATALADRLVTAMQQPINVNGEPVLCVASIGIALTEPGAGDMARDLLHRADIAMYQAKTHSGSNWQLAEPTPRPAPAPAVIRRED
jgi:diguanylate cyclase